MTRDSKHISMWASPKKDIFEFSGDRKTVNRIIKKFKGNNMGNYFQDQLIEDLKPELENGLVSIENNDSFYFSMMEKFFSCLRFKNRLDSDSWRYS